MSLTHNEVHIVNTDGTTRRYGSELAEAISDSLHACYDEPIALYPHNEDDIIYMNAHFYKCLQDISVGSSIIVGTTVVDALIPSNTFITVRNLPGTPVTTSELDALETRVDANMGTIETGNSAAYSHAVGETFIWKDRFVKVTAAINVADPIVIGTNVASTTISAVLAQLNQNLVQISSVGQGIDLMSYVGTFYTFPSDGYLTVVGNGAPQDMPSIVHIYAPNTNSIIAQLIPDPLNVGNVAYSLRVNSIYVKKNMRCAIVGGAYPLPQSLTFWPFEY